MFSEAPYGSPVYWRVDSVEPIRILLANYPTMIPDAVREVFERHPDLAVIGDVRGPMRILQEAGRTKADAIILAQAGIEEPGLYSQLLSVYPDLTILAIAPDMKSASIHQLCPQRLDLLNIQTENLVEALRAAVREPCKKPD
jgi:hypothetical protein